MLSGYQCEVVAYMGEGEIICPACARDTWSTVALEKCERGLDNSTGLTPLIRYSIDEWIGERKYEDAQERYDAMEDAHPVLLAAILEHREQWALLDRIASRIPDEACAPSCDSCYQPITG